MVLGREQLVILAAAFTVIAGAVAIRSRRRRWRLEAARKRSLLVARREAEPFDLDDPQWDDTEQSFRFSRREIRQLLDALEIPGVCEVSERSRRTLPGELSFCIWLYRMAHGVPYHTLALIFRVPTTTACRASDFITRYVFDKWSWKLTVEAPVSVDLELVKERADEWVDAVSRKMGYRVSIWAFVDGTFLPIARPSGGFEVQRPYFNGHHQSHGVVWLGVMTPDGILRCFFGPDEGARHDNSLLVTSEILSVNAALNNSRMPPVRGPGALGPIPDRLVLLGDLGFSTSDDIVTPWKKPRGQRLSRVEQRLNRLLASSRVAIEWRFGQMRRPFHILDRPVEMQNEPTALNIAPNVAFLTNLRTILDSERGGRGLQVVDYFDCRPESLERHLAFFRAQPDRAAYLRQRRRP